jgi:Sec-independent protein translocase protein TatA
MATFIQQVMRDIGWTHKLRRAVPGLILDRNAKAVQALFLEDETITTHFVYSRRCQMQKLIVIGFAALCLIGTSSLALADETMKDGMGNMKDGMKSDLKAQKKDIKGQTKAHKEKVKATGSEPKGKMKAHKHATKAKAGEAKGGAKTMKHDMKATVPAAPSLNAAQ